MDRRGGLVLNFNKGQNKYVNPGRRVNPFNLWPITKLSQLQFFLVIKIRVEKDQVCTRGRLQSTFHNTGDLSVIKTETSPPLLWSNLLSHPLPCGGMSVKLGWNMVELTEVYQVLQRATKKEDAPRCRPSSYSLHFHVRHNQPAYHHLRHQEFLILGMASSIKHLCLPESIVN